MTTQAAPELKTERITVHLTPTAAGRLRDRAEREGGRRPGELAARLLMQVLDPLPAAQSLAARK